VLICIIIMLDCFLFLCFLFCIWRKNLKSVRWSKEFNSKYFLKKFRSHALLLGKLW
jgi:hypothetical protein